MDRIVVNDTNVFIDLICVGLLEQFFQLPWEIHTTDFVMLELKKEGQREAVEKFKYDGYLNVASFEAEEVSNVHKLKEKYTGKTNISMTDCSVLYYAKRNGYVLLTGDRKLRSTSTVEGVEVRGIIYVFDTLVENNILPPDEAAQKLKMLFEQNSRLPKDEIERRIKLWGSGNKDTYLASGQP